MTLMPRKVSGTIPVENDVPLLSFSESVANKRVYSPTEGFTALRHVIPSPPNARVTPQPRGSLVLLVGLQLFQQILRGPCGAATDLGVTTFYDFANLVHRHNLSAENDRDLPTKVVAVVQDCLDFP